MSGDEIARDGSPVELYDRWLPPLGEAELVHDVVAAGSPVLELGCGAGRVTRRLVALGHPVVAVDESPAMLRRHAHHPMVETVCAAASALDLDRRFGAVMLGSQLVNTADDGVRRALLISCRRHLARGGLVFIERLDPRWADVAWAGMMAARSSRIGDVVITSRELHLDPPYLTQCTEYALPDGRTWRQGPYTMRVLDDATLMRDLGHCGLVLDRWLPWQRAARIWCAARRLDGGAATPPTGGQSRPEQASGSR